ncbi:MAG: FtsX-like permease family protein [Luteitalea sp.]|nr:FtsX-like permease family protein [Luteitalea sp.]
MAAAISEVDRHLSLTFRPLDEGVNASLLQERIMAMLSGFFGALALLLAAIGLCGVTSYSVSRRRAEIGIRMALGASPESILRSVVGYGLRLSAAGIALGLVAALLLTRGMTTMLVGVKPTDPVTFAAIGVVFFVVAAVSSWLPARRAAGLDPTASLRER